MCQGWVVLENNILSERHLCISDILPLLLLFPRKSCDPSFNKLKIPLHSSLVGSVDVKCVNYLLMTGIQKAVVRQLKSSLVLFFRFANTCNPKMLIFMHFRSTLYQCYIKGVLKFRAGNFFFHFKIENQIFCH